MFEFISNFYTLVLSCVIPVPLAPILNVKTGRIVQWGLSTERLAEKDPPYILTQI